MGFTDDVNILAYVTSTEENVRTLERVHKHCEKWARRHGSTFAPKKYELIYLARDPGKFNMAATITIGKETKAPMAHIRVLGIQIDTRLRWGPHIRKIQEKMVTQTRALTKVATSMWVRQRNERRRHYLRRHGKHQHHRSRRHPCRQQPVSPSFMGNRCVRQISGCRRGWERVCEGMDGSVWGRAQL